MANLKNHPGYWLRDDAADSLERMEAEYGGPFSISDAGRTVAQQNQLIARWNQGGKYNRPPYLYEPASPSVSPHVINGGAAIDVDNSNHRAWIKANGRKHGWRFNIPSDVVHAIYEAQHDQYRTGGPSAGGNSGVAQQQDFLNKYRSESLEVDGELGPKTREAFKRYQTFLKNNYGYAGLIDGDWGPATQAAHAKYWAVISKPPVYTPSIPSAQKWNGVQEMLKALYGYTGAIDNRPGPGTITAFQRFLKANGYNPGAVDGSWGQQTGMAAQRWLRAKWGYDGLIDNQWGPKSLEAWARAEAANAAAF